MTDEPSSFRSGRPAFLMILALFFTWGFLTALNDVLVADFRSIFHLSYRSATLVQFAFFSACFLSSFPSSRLVAGLGYKRTMIAGLVIMAIAELGFARDASVPAFSIFLFTLMVMAAGSTALQTAAGPYVSLLGSPESAPSRFSVALGINSLGSMLAPSFGALFLLHDVKLSSASQALSLRLPSLGIAAGLGSLAVVLAGSGLSEIEPSKSFSNRQTTYREILKHRRLTFGVAAMLLYVGAEIAIGSLLINFLGQQETLALQPRQASMLASLYGGGMMVGRFAAPFILKRLPAQKLLLLSAASATFLLVVCIFSTGPISAFSLIAIGLCNSVMVPIIFTSSISGLGPLTGKASGLLVAALIGGALIPLAQGAVADHIGLHHSFAVLLPCYLCVLLYSLFLMAQPLDPAGAGD